MNTRRNRGDLPLSGGDPRLIKRYTDWHWGIGPTRLIKWEDPDLPDNLVEIGRCVAFELRVPGQRTLAHLTLPDAAANRSHVVFDGDLPASKAPIYVLLPKDVRADMKRTFWDDADEIMDAAEVQRLVGGRHAKDPLPRIKVAPIGLVNSGTYFCWKKGDDDNVPGSLYKHKFGEESKVAPALCCDARGRLWLIGGNYTVPNPGITD